MLDLNSLTLYKEKISSYIDENVLTFPTESKINSLFNEIHKYKIIIKTSNASYGSSVACVRIKTDNDKFVLTNVKTVKDKNTECIMNCVKKNSNNNTIYDVHVTAIDAYLNTTANEVLKSFYDCGLYEILDTETPNNFDDWYLSNGGSYKPLTYEFNVSNLSTFQFFPNRGCMYSSRYADNCYVDVYCDDNLILSDYLDKLSYNSMIKVKFDDYDTCHTEEILVPVKPIY